MTSRDFCFWAQGFFELSETKTLNEKQTEIFKAHLNLVFFHEIDPSYSDETNYQLEMNNIHNSFPPIMRPASKTDDTLLRC